MCYGMHRLFGWGLVILGMIVSSITTISQTSIMVQVSLAISPNPSPYLSDWETQHETAILILQNMSPNELFVRLDVKCRVDNQQGAVIAETKLGDMPVLQLPARQVLTLTGRDIVPFNAVRFFGSVDKVATRTGRIPPGNYVLCVGILDAEREQPVSQVICRQFSIQIYRPPVLLQPVNGTVITEATYQSTVFRWTRETPPLTNSTHRFVLVEVYPNQNATEALLVNQPIAQAETPGGTPQTIWPPGHIISAEPGRSFAWSVQVSNPNGHPLCNPPWAEPFSFTIPVSTDGTTRRQTVEWDLGAHIQESRPISDAHKEVAFMVAQRIAPKAVATLAGDKGTLVNARVTVPADKRIESESIRSVTWSVYGFDDASKTWHPVTTAKVDQNPFQKDVIETFQDRRQDQGSGEAVGDHFRAVTFQYKLPDVGTYKIVAKTEIFEEAKTTGGIQDLKVEERYVIVHCPGTEPGTDTKDAEKKNPCKEILLTGPGKPCSGSVGPDNESPDPVITASWTTTGTFDHFIVTVYPNPCGKYPPDDPVPPPHITTPPGGGGGSVTTTPSGSKGTPAHTCPPVSGSGNSTKVPVGEVIEPGGAYIIEVTGICKKSDGSVETVTSVPNCSRYRPTVPTGGGLPPVPVPVPICPGSRPENCVKSDEPDPGTAIKAVIELDAPDNYPYPRAVPLRGKAIDWDLWFAKCVDCPGSLDQKSLVVRDEINSYHWRLNGKGSLNTPIDGQQAATLQDSLASLMKRLAEIQDSLSMLRTRRDSIEAAYPAMIKKAQDDSANVAKQIATADSTLTALISVIAEKYQRLGELVQTLDSLKTESAARRIVVEAMADSLARYDSLLLNPLTSAEASLVGALESLDAAILATGDLITAKLMQIETESNSLKGAIVAADTALALAEAAYLAQRNSAAAIMKLIDETMSNLYHHPLLPNYRASRNTWMRTASQVSVLCMIPAGTNTSFATANNEWLSTAQTLLKTAPGAARTTHWRKFDSLNTVIVTKLAAPHVTITDTAQRRRCQEMLADFQGKRLDFFEKVHGCHVTGRRLSPVLLARLDSLRTVLAATEASFASLQVSVTSATNASAAARTSWANRMKVLELEKRSLVRAADSLSNKRKNDHREYVMLRDARDSAFTVNKPILLTNKAEKGKIQRDAAAAIDTMEIKFDVAHRDTVVIIAFIDSVRVDSVRLDKEITLLKELLKQIQSILNTKFEDLLKPVDDAIAMLQADSSDLEAQIEAMRGKVDDAVSGNKSASGEFVYYIPPPLEVIMKEPDKERFLDLQDSVRVAEAKYEQALSSKGNLQNKFVSMVAEIARNLAAIKVIEGGLKKLKDEAKEAEDKAGELEKASEDEWNKKKAKLDSIAATAVSAKDTATARIAKAITDSSDAERDREFWKEELDGRRTALKEKKDSLQAAVSRFEERKADMAKNTDSVVAKANSTESIRGDKRKATGEIVKKQDEVTRSALRESMGEMVSASSGLQSAKNVETAKKAEEQASLVSLEALGAKFSADFSKMVAADSSVAKAARDYKKALNDVYDALSEVLKAQNRIAQAIQERMYWEEVLRKAEKLSQGVEHARTIMPPKDKAKDADDVSDAKATARKLEDAVTKAEGDIKAMKEKIDKSAKDRKKLEEDAKKNLEEADTQLKKANSELVTFLDSLFNKPGLEDTLFLTVDDAVVDGFRSGDKVLEIMEIIKYEAGTGRIPQLPKKILDDSGPAPRNVSGTCITTIEFKQPGDIGASAPSLNKPEPRTIALIYQEGRPLWPQWPVFSESKVIAKDHVILSGSARDMDVYIHKCQTTTPGCLSPKPNELGIVDIPYRKWVTPAPFHNLYDISPLVVWEASSAGGCSEPIKVKAEFRAPDIKADPLVETENKIDVLPGVMVEVTDSLVGWPKRIDTVRARIVTGDHKGLGGESIKITVELEKGVSKGWGIKSPDTKETTESTDGNGYVKVPFHFGDGFAQFKFKAEWNRGEMCKEEEFTAISPLNLKLHTFGTAAADVAWKAAEKIFDGADAGAILSSLPEAKEGEGTYDKIIHGVAGLLDEQREFVNDKELTFTPISGFAIKPTADKTRSFGIARTVVTDDLSDKGGTLKVEPEKELADVTRPPEDSKSLGGASDNEFFIGEPNDLFVIVTDEPFDPDDEDVELSGTGKIKVTAFGAFIAMFAELPVTIEGVRLRTGKVAKEGRITYSSSSLQTSIYNFQLSVTDISIVADVGAEIKGTVNHTTLPRPVEYTALMNTKGEFYGEVKELPELNFMDFRLKEGSALALDFHPGYPINDPLGEDFRGVVIGRAELELPKYFDVPKTDTRTMLSARMFAIGSTGVSGTLSISGGPIRMGSGGFALSVSALTMTFDKSKLESGSITGGLEFDKPFKGAIEATLTANSDGAWSAELKEGSNVSIPRLGLNITIKDGTNLSWTPEPPLGELTVKAVVNSEKVGTMNINEFYFATNGNLRLEVELPADQKPVKVLGGLDLALSGLVVNRTSDDYLVRVSGEIGIPDLISVKGAVEVTTGPSVNFSIDEGRFNYDKAPFNISGEVQWNNDEFFATISAKIKNFVEASGTLQVGSAPKAAGGTYTYWYFGLNVGACVVLGQSGLAFTSFGGGVGWNCDPPLEGGKASARFTDGIALLASIGVGNSLPTCGKVINSRFTATYSNPVIGISGRVWLLDMEEHLFGSGKLSVNTATGAVTGDVRGLIALPDKKGRLVNMSGLIKFDFGPGIFLIQSEYLRATVFNLLTANASLRVAKDSSYLKGSIGYSVGGEADIGIGYLKAYIAVNANGEILIVPKPTFQASARLSFNGEGALTFRNRFVEFDIASATASFDGVVATVAGKFKMAASADLQYTVLGISGSANYDVGFEI